MTNTTELLNELIRNAKALRFADHPNKAKKHRYTRRKVRGFIRLGDWKEDESI
jgi:hypothetical protein